MRNVTLPFGAVLLVAAVALHASPQAAIATEPQQSPAAVKMYDVFEVTLTSDAEFDNPFSDASVSAEFVSPAGKPILCTEFGNRGDFSNYDPLKWRIAAWTAFMNESNILFWGQSGAKSIPNPKGRGNSNAYLGPETRQSLRVLNEFTKDLPVDMRPVEIWIDTYDVRINTLSNGNVTVVYAHNYKYHTKEKKKKWTGTLYVQTGPGKFDVKWVDPVDGKVVKSEQVETVRQYAGLKVPPIAIDMACRIDRIE